VAAAWQAASAAGVILMLMQRQAIRGMRPLMLMLKMQRMW
jgi:hypothetical protein